MNIIGKKKIRIIMALLITCIMAVAMPVTTFAAGDALKDKGVLEYNSAYEYVLDKRSSEAVGASGDISYGWYSLGSKLSYMKFPAEYVKDGGVDGAWCYCIDITTSTVDGHNYSITTLDAAEYYEDAASGKIRAILLNSYPNLSVEELEKKYNLTDLTEEEAFLATQWIVWYYSNPGGEVEASGGHYYPAELYKPSAFSRTTTRIDYTDENGNEVSKQSENVVKLAKALDALPAEAGYTTEPVVVEYAQRMYTDKVVFDLKETTNIEDLDINNIVVKNSKGDIIPFTMAGTRIAVQLEDLDFEGDAANIIIEVTGIQELSEDAYFFAPEDGRSASQSRVAVFEGIAPVTNETSYILKMSMFEQADNDAELKVTKNVLVNGKAHRGEDKYYVALFEDKECTKVAEFGDVRAIDMGGNSSGSVVFDELIPDKTYYVAETDADGKVLKDGDCGIETIAYENQDVTVDADIVEETVVTNCYTEISGDGIGDGGENGSGDAGKGDGTTQTGDENTFGILAGLMMFTALAVMGVILVQTGRLRRN